MRCKDMVINYKSANKIALYLPYFIKCIGYQQTILIQAALNFPFYRVGTSKALSYPLL
jgi:hypothetical protein